MTRYGKAKDDKGISRTGVSDNGHGMIQELIIALRHTERNAKGLIHIRNMKRIDSGELGFSVGC